MNYHVMAQSVLLANRPDLLPLAGGTPTWVIAVMVVLGIGCIALGVYLRRRTSSPR